MNDEKLLALGYDFLTLATQYYATGRWRKARRPNKEAAMKSSGESSDSVSAHW